jgi:hypothetical protein
MKVFLLDLWLDLREKRLAPVALLLLAAVIAVPIALSKKSESAPPPTTVTTASAAPAAPVVESQPQEGPVDSKLQTFSPRDPFEPTGHAATATTGTSGATTGTSTGTTTGTTGSTTTGTGTSGGVTTGSGPTTGTGTTGTGGTTGETKTTFYTYTSDLKFGPGGDVKTYKDVKRLELIPSASDPKLVFLGVTTTGKTAVFLVDNSIGVDTGEGKCRPSPDQCTFLYLRPDSDHDQATLTDSDGNVFQMRLLAIHRVTVASANGNTNSGSGNSNGTSGNGTSRSPAFTGSASGETVPGDTPPGEPDKRSSNFQQFFLDGSADDTTSKSPSDSGASK